MSIKDLKENLEDLKIGLSILDKDWEKIRSFIPLTNNLINLRKEIEQNIIELNDLINMTLVVNDKRLKDYYLLYVRYEEFWNKQNLKKTEKELTELKKELKNEKDNIKIKQIEKKIKKIKGLINEKKKNQKIKKRNS